MQSSGNCHPPVQWQTGASPSPETAEERDLVPSNRQVSCQKSLQGWRYVLFEESRQTVLDVRGRCVINLSPVFR